MTQSKLFTNSKLRRFSPLNNKTIISNKINIKQYHYFPNMNHNLCILSGSSNLDLAEKIANHLQVTPTETKIRQFANSEIDIEITKDVRNCHVYIIQSGCMVAGKSVNDMMMELLLMINACVLSSAFRITVIMPIFPYARSDKKTTPNGCIGSSIIVECVKKTGAHRIVSLDLHSGQIQGYAFNKPFINLYTADIFIEFMNKTLNIKENPEEYILVSPDYGGIKRIEEFSNKMNLNYVTIHKRRDIHKLNTITSVNIIGGEEKLINKTAIIIDDMVDTMGTMIAAVGELIKYGAKDVIIVATHGIFSGEAINRINNCAEIRKVIVTNTIPQNNNIIHCPKIMVADVSLMLSEFISKNHY